MSILIDDRAFINLKFHYIETIDQFVTKFKFIQSKEEFEQYKNDPNLKELNTGWKVLSWADHNNIYSQCLQYSTNEEGLSVSSLDFIKFRDMKLKLCLKQWDLKDQDKRPIPVSAAIVDKLHPDVANELLAGFERVTEVSGQDLKN